MHKVHDRLYIKSEVDRTNPGLPICSTCTVWRAFCRFVSVTPSHGARSAEGKRVFPVFSLLSYPRRKFSTPGLSCAPKLERKKRTDADALYGGLYKSAKETARGSFPLPLCYSAASCSRARRIERLYGLRSSGRFSSRTASIRACTRSSRPTRPSVYCSRFLEQ